MLLLRWFLACVVVGVVLMSGLPARAGGFMTLQAAHGRVPVLFVSDGATNAVWLFNASDLSGPAIGEITDGMTSPGEMSVDGRGNLYVLTGGAIEIFAPGALRYSRRIAVKNGTLYCVAVAPDGTLATFVARSGLTKGTLEIFDRGSRTPTRRIAIPLGNNFEFPRANVAIDTFGDVFLSVTRYPRGPDQMLEVAAGSTQTVVTGLPTALGMAFDGADNLYLGASNGSTGFVSVYPQGATQPLYSITDGVTLPFNLTAFTNGTIFVANAKTQNQDGDVLEFAPGATSPELTMRNDDDTAAGGTAYRPALRKDLHQTRPL